MFQFAVAKNLNPEEISANQFRLAQRLLVDCRSSFEFIQIAQIHGRVILVKGSIVESAFRQSPNQWHLSAFKSEPKTSARARLLAFVTFAARLAVAGALANAESLHAMSRAGSRPQGM